jgi:hypothetical protein
MRLQLLLATCAFFSMQVAAKAGMNWTSTAGNCWRPMSMDVGSGPTSLKQVTMFTDAFANCSEATRQALDRVTFWSAECCWPVEVSPRMQKCPLNGKDLTNNPNITYALFNLNGKNSNPKNSDCKKVSSGQYQAMAIATCYNAKIPNVGQPADNFGQSDAPLLYQFSDSDLARCQAGKSKKYP